MNSSSRPVKEHRSPKEKKRDERDKQREKKKTKHKDTRTQKHHKKRGKGPMCFTILGHGADISVAPKDQSLLKVPYAIKTPPGYYGYSSYVTDINLMKFLSRSESSHPGDTIDQRIKALNEADPDFVRDDKYGAKTLWRKTKKNLYCNIADTSFCKGIQCSDVNRRVELYTPYGIYLSLIHISEPTRPY